jgi:copper homeostasis protein
MTAFTLEVCVDTVDLLDICATPMVDRIELCSALSAGGLTPSLGLMRCAYSVREKTHAMIRPRAGDFVYGARDIDAMHADINAAKDAGLAGIVIGAATRERDLDVVVLRDLIGCAGDLCITLHRVIDTLIDPLVAIDIAVDLGINRILSSGMETAAAQGADFLAQMKQHAGDRIEIMVGAGVTAQNLTDLASKTGIHDFHSSGSYGAVALSDPFGLGAVADPQHVLGNISKMHAVLNSLKI